MILRKPYVFLGKHFKKIHFILMAMLIYLAYKTNGLINFINDYMQNQSIITETGNLFTILMFFFPFLWILISVTIISLMVQKKKPITFYIINIAMAIFVLVMYVYINSLSVKMQIQLIDIRVVRAVRDIIVFMFLAQIGVTIMVGVRATGFDIKKFNFGAELEGMELSEEDREEFEVNLELDTDKTKRNARKGIRYTKYIYVENKYLINLIISVIVLVFGFFTFMDLVVYNKSFKESERFTIGGLNMQIQNGYVLTQDYRGKRVTPEGKSLVVVDLNVKKVATSRRKIETATAMLIVNNHKYYPTEKYRDKTIDLGRTYGSEEITDSVNYLLVYEIPTKYANKTMKFVYEDKNTFVIGIQLQSASVKFSPINLEKGSKDIELTLNEEATLKDSIIKDSTLLISSSDLASIFENRYKFCVKKEECYDSVEYVKPDIVNRYPKTLLKLSGVIKLGEKSHIQEVFNLYDLIEMVGQVSYKIGDQVKKQTLPFKEVIPNKKVEENTYYIELQKEIENADEIELVLKLRNRNYHYKLK